MTVHPGRRHCLGRRLSPRRVLPGCVEDRRAQTSSGTGHRRGWRTVLVLVLPGCVENRRAQTIAFLAETLGASVRNVSGVPHGGGTGRRSYRPTRRGPHVTWSMEVAERLGRSLGGVSSGTLGHELGWRRHEGGCGTVLFVSRERHVVASLLVGAESLIQYQLSARFPARTGILVRGPIVASDDGGGKRRERGGCSKLPGQMPLRRPR